MPKIRLNNLRFTDSFNKGFWIVAKIYSDVKGGCSCGGAFTGKDKLKNIEYPVCDKCGETPTLLRIRAKIVTPDLVEKYVDVRHTPGRVGQRLRDIIDCLSTLKQIESEIEKGTFDIRDYDSLSARESYQFKNYSAAYEKFHANRLKGGEISPGGFKNKQKYIKVLNKYFAEYDIATIKIKQIDEFKGTLSDKKRTRDLALGELKAILNHADKYGDLNHVPKFDLVPASKKRKEIITIEQALKVIDAIDDEQYQLMTRLLTIYPVRPGELRALQWRDIDYFGKKVFFRRHFSNEILIDGRKSIKDGDQSELDFPLTPLLLNYMHSIPRPLNSEEFIFKGKEKAFVSENCLARAWRKATKKLKMPAVQMYECRHARITQLIEQSNGNFSVGLKASGHTNANTLVQRYFRSTADLSEFFQ